MSVGRCEHCRGVGLVEPSPFHHDAEARTPWPDFANRVARECLLDARPGEDWRARAARRIRLAPPVACPACGGGPRVVRLLEVEADGEAWEVDGGRAFRVDVATAVEVEPEGWSPPAGLDVPGVAWTFRYRPGPE